MKTFELLQELDAEADLAELLEAKRRRQKLPQASGGEKKTGGAQNFVVKNMNLAGKGGAQKAKKGKGSYSRKRVNKNDY